MSFQLRGNVCMPLGLSATNCTAALARSIQDTLGPGISGFMLKGFRVKSNVQHPSESAEVLRFRALDSGSWAFGVYGRRSWGTVARGYKTKLYGFRVKANVQHPSESIEVLRFREVQGFGQ